MKETEKTFINPHGVIVRIQRKWDEQEEAILKEMAERHTDPVTGRVGGYIWQKIAEKVGRTPQACEKRYWENLKPESKKTKRPELSGPRGKYNKGQDTVIEFIAKHRELIEHVVWSNTKSGTQGMKNELDRIADAVGVKKGTFNSAWRVGGFRPRYSKEIYNSNRTIYDIHF